MYKKNLKNQTRYICPFCKKDIVSSKKTEIYYRSNWTNGCYDCFASSINELTTVDFHQKNYSI